MQGQLDDHQSRGKNVINDNSLIRHNCRATGRSLSVQTIIICAITQSCASCEIGHDFFVLEDTLKQRLELSASVNETTPTSFRK